MFQMSWLQCQCSSAGGVFCSAVIHQRTQKLSPSFPFYLSPKLILCSSLSPFFLWFTFFISSLPVKPNPPEKVTVNTTWDKRLPYLRVSWEPPQKADTRSGWITLVYELRIKMEGEDEWEVTCGVAWLAQIFVFQRLKNNNNKNLHVVRADSSQKPVSYLYQLIPRWHV